MNNLELRKAIQKINHACGDCGGGGCDNSINKEDWDNQKSHVRIDYKNCKTCSGTGIDIPLDKSKHSLVCNENTFSEDSCNCGYQEPITLGHLYMAIQTKTGIYFRRGITIHMTIEDNNGLCIPIDLSKTHETQTQEVINQLIEILS